MRFATSRQRLVAAQRARGVIDDERVLDAMESIPRERFVPTESRRDAYADRALPIASGQTISQPSLVGLMTAALALTPDDHVLEIGTGSGYQAAILSRIAARVTSVERLEDLATTASAVLGELDITNVVVHVGDGSLGWPDDAPYDAIVVTAGAPAVPPALLEQLAVGGRLVAPVGPRGHEELVCVRRTSPEATDRRVLGAVAFVPLIGEQGW